jgi:HEAT repeat protein
MGGRKPLAEWAQLLRSEDERVRDEARLQLIRRGGRLAVEAFTAAMDDERDDVRTHAVQGLVRVGGGIEVLLAHLNDDPCGMVRLLCATGIRPPSVESNTPAVVEALLAALRDPWDAVVCMACLLLAALGDLRCVEPLRGLLTNQPWKVRREACRALYRLGSVDTALLSAAEELDRTWEGHYHNLHVYRSRQVDASLGIPVATHLDPTTKEMIAGIKELLKDRCG